MGQDGQARFPTRTRAPVPKEVEFIKVRPDRRQHATPKVKGFRPDQCLFRGHLTAGSGRTWRRAVAAQKQVWTKLSRRLITAASRSIRTASRRVPQDQVLASLLSRHFSARGALNRPASIREAGDPHRLVRTGIKPLTYPPLPLQSAFPKTIVAKPRVQYISTRGTAPSLPFDDVLLAGLASDGGLYVPSSWPQFTHQDLGALTGLSYSETAFHVIRRFVGDSIADSELEQMTQAAYDVFSHPAVAPLRQLDRNDWLIELFHGPTLAFKDFALQLVGHMFDHVLRRRGKRVTVVGATSGDTGSAAIEACRGRERVDIFVLFPKGRVSTIQRLQMTTVQAENVYPIAVEGTFDDCQDLVKAMFNDARFNAAHNLAAFNSINWARVMAQIVYYVYAGLRLGAPARSVSFAVPTGNFGNVLAGWVAWKMGLPVERLVVGTNRNDILFRFFESGSMKLESVEPTISPSMDIQVASNFERLLFDMLGSDADRVTEWMERFRKKRVISVDGQTLDRARTKFAAARLDDDATLDVMRDLHAATGLMVDPHSAIGIEAGRRCRGDSGTPMISLATAHPAKFPDAVTKATGEHPALPPRMADLESRSETYAVLPNRIDDVKSYIRRTIAHSTAA